MNGTVTRGEGVQRDQDFLVVICDLSLFTFWMELLRWQHPQTQGTLLLLQREEVERGHECAQMKRVEDWTDRQAKQVDKGERSL